MLGSREQLCINTEVQAADNNTVMTHLCRKKVQARTCRFHFNMESNRGNPRSQNAAIMDIEVGRGWLG